MADLIVLGVIIWLVLGFIIAFGMSECDFEDRACTLGFFWPITLPIALVFGIIWSVYTMFKIGLSWFKEEK